MYNAADEASEETALYHDMTSSSTFQSGKIFRIYMVLWQTTRDPRRCYTAVVPAIVSVAAYNLFALTSPAGLPRAHTYKKKRVSLHFFSNQVFIQDSVKLKKGDQQLGFRPHLYVFSTGLVRAHNAHSHRNHANLTGSRGTRHETSYLITLLWIPGIPSLRFVVKSQQISAVSMQSYVIFSVHHVISDID